MCNLLDVMYVYQNKHKVKKVIADNDLSYSPTDLIPKNINGQYIYDIKNYKGDFTNVKSFIARSMIDMGSEIKYFG